MKTRRRQGPDRLMYDVPSHVHVLKGRWRWVPPPRWRAFGAVAEKLSDEPIFTRAAFDRANDLNEFWHQCQLEREGVIYAPSKIPGSVGWLLDEFQKSVQYRLMKPSTQEGVDWAFRVLADSPIARHPVKAVERKHCKSLYQVCFDEYGHHQALTVVKWLRRALTFAMDDKGLIKTNPAFALGLTHPKARQVVWTWDEIRAVAKSALRLGRRSVALALLLAYDCGQRPGDVRSVTWAQFDGEGIAWAQAKTNAVAWTPLTDLTNRFLRRTARSATGHIVVSETTGTPYTKMQWSRAFRLVLKAAKIKRQLWLADTRRTAGTEILAGGGRAEPLTGHRINSPVLRTYQVPSKEAARSAQRSRQRVDTLLPAQKASTITRDTPPRGSKKA